MPTIIEISESSDQKVEEPTPMDTPPERLPAELMDRIAKHLGDERKAPDKSNYAALLVRLFNSIKKEEEYLVLEKQEKEPEGHPIDWAYPTRLLWTASHLTRLIYRPIVELENWYDEGPGSFKNIHSLQHRLDEVDPDRRLFSTLDILVLDLSRYEGALSARDAIEDHDYGDDDPHRRILATAYLIRQGQDGPYRDYINDFPALEDLLPLLAEGFRFKQTCIRRGPAYGRIFDLDTIKTDSITLHDFLGLRCGDYSGLELRAPEIVCSFISSFQAIASRLRAIDRVPQFITHEVRAIVLARPKGREKPYSRQMNFMTKHWENTGKRCKVNWRYLENAEDGVPRCKACGDEIF